MLILTSEILVRVLKLDRVISQIAKHVLIMLYSFSVHTPFS